MEDRISQLADELLCHVLSFLPTRKSVQTAIVLSKQWYNVCESITTLNIDCRRDFGRTTLRNIDRFADFVDDAVSLLGWSKIQKLSLSCPGFCDHYRIIYHLPIPGCFSSLKSLSLSLVYQDSPDIENLITNCCPLLEDLDIRGDILLPHDTLLFKISAPKLQKLTLEIDLATEGRSSSVIINSPKLESITLKREHSQYSAYILEKTESLNRAVVDFAGRGKDVMTQLLAAFSGVKDLYIGAAFIKNCDLPAEFSKLNKLQLILHPNSYREYVTILLNKSPNLEYLVLELDNKYELQVPAFTPPQFVPVSLSLHLKKIHMRGFCNRRGELKVLYYLLQHSKALNVLVISSHPTLCHSEEEALYKSILGFPGVSKTFQVRFL